MPRSKVIHLVSGGTLGETHAACGLRAATGSEADQRMSINPARVTCSACRRSDYFEKMAPVFARQEEAYRARRGG